MCSLGGLYPVVCRVREHKRRTCRIIGLSGILGACAVAFPHHSLLTFATGGIVYGIISRHGAISPRGWMSIRGVVMALYAFLFLTFVLTAAILFVAFKSEEQTGEESVIAPVAEKTYPFSRLTIHVVNGYIGN